MKHEKWRIVMRQEIDTLEFNGTLTLTQLPSNKNALDSSRYTKLNLNLIELSRSW